MTTWWVILIVIVLVLLASLMALSMVLTHREKMAGVEQPEGK